MDFTKQAKLIYIVYWHLYRTLGEQIYAPHPILDLMTSMSGLRSTISVKRVESISDVIKSLGAISCDSCNGKLASYDVYMDGGVDGVPFLKRYCSDCIQNVTH